MKGRAGGHRVDREEFGELEDVVVEDSRELLEHEVAVRCAALLLAELPLTEIALRDPRLASSLLSSAFEFTRVRVSC